MYTLYGLPRWRSGKEFACQCKTCHRHTGWIPWWGRSPAEEMATSSSILDWKIPWTEEPGELLSMGSQRVGHDLATEHTHIPCVMITAVKLINISNTFVCGGGGEGGALKIYSQEFPGSPVLRTPCFHCPNSVPSWGINIPQVVGHGQKTKKFLPSAHFKYVIYY